MGSKCPFFGFFLFLIWIFMVHWGLLDLIQFPIPGIVGLNSIQSCSTLILNRMSSRIKSSINLGENTSLLNINYVMLMSKRVLKNVSNTITRFNNYNNDFRFDYLVHKIMNLPIIKQLIQMFSVCKLQSSIQECVN